MIVEMGKEYRIEGAEHYRLLAIDGGGECPVIGMVKFTGNDLWKITRHTISGSHHGDAFGKLVEVKPRIKGEFWIAHYDDGSRLMLSDNTRCHDNGVVAITHHTYDCEEGEGLK